MFSVLYFPLYLYVALPLISSALSSAKSIAPESKVATAWFAGWHAKNATPIFGVTDVSWEKYTKLTYSFA